MIILVDSREKDAYTFGSIPTVRRKLDVGDYSIEGFEDSVAIERKELNDYVGTVIYQRERFKKELSKLAGYEMKAIVVEASMSDILDGRYKSRVSPKAVIGATVGIFLSYNIPIFFCSNRQIALHFTETLLRKFYAKRSGVKVKK